MRTVTAKVNPSHANHPHSQKPAEEIPMARADTCSTSLRFSLDTKERCRDGCQPKKLEL